MLKPELEKNIERAIRFLAKAMDESGRNSKPVTLHSMRVANYLYSIDAVDDTVIAAVLHDIVEDTDTKLEEIEGSFGKVVKDLVSICTFDDSIQNKEERYQENFQRILSNKQALIIRTADLLDNSNYYQFAASPEEHKQLVAKMHYFLELAKPIIQDEICWQDLKRKSHLLQNKF